MPQALLLLALACGGAAVEDDDEDEVVDTGDERPASTDDCTELVLTVDGPEAPHVGDEWDVWLRCDGALLTGSMVLRFDPPETASVSDNHATFLQAGTATMRMQVGNRRVEEEVTVEP